MDVLQSYLSIWEILAEVIPGATVSSKSIESLRRRAEDDPIQTFERDLPSLGKAVYRSLATPGLQPVDGWKFQSGRPVFLRELFSHVYDVEGNLHREKLLPSQIRTLRKIMQLCMVFYKVEREATDAHVKASVEAFEAIQGELLNLPAWLHPEDHLILGRARDLIHKVLNYEDPSDIKPRHGSGAVYDRSKNSEKWRLWPHYPEIDRIWPDTEYQFLSDTHLCDELDGLDERETVEYPSVRITTVPKNSDSVRMIAVEEAYPQFIKLGVMDKLYRIIERHPLTRGYVNFGDQTINQSYAKYGSMDSSYATIDLSAASDSVSDYLVKYLFPARWYAAFNALRAREAHVDGRKIPLTTFSTMGSAICFPVEALVFWAVTSACIGTTQVVVYGDDIIVPNDQYEVLAREFHRFGFRINDTKSYHTGFFRESCGADFFLGKSVRTIKWRKPPEESCHRSEHIVSFLNNLSEEYGQDIGERASAHFARIQVFPRSTDPNNKGYAFITKEGTSSNDVFYRRRYNSEYQRYEYRLRVSRPLVVSSKTTSWYETMRSVLQQGHRTRSGKYDEPRNVIHSWAWAPL